MKKERCIRSSVVALMGVFLISLCACGIKDKPEGSEDLSDTGSLVVGEQSENEDNKTAFEDIFGVEPKNTGDIKTGSTGEDNTSSSNNKDSDFADIGSNDGSDNQQGINTENESSSEGQGNSGSDISGSGQNNQENKDSETESLDEASDDEGKWGHIF